MYYAPTAIACVRARRTELAMARQLTLPHLPAVCHIDATMSFYAARRQLRDLRKELSQTGG